MEEIFLLDLESGENETFNPFYNETVNPNPKELFEFFFYLYFFLKKGENQSMIQVAYPALKIIDGSR